MTISNSVKIMKQNSIESSYGKVTLEPWAIGALERLVYMCEVHGDFSNGVTDSSGSIDEGNVIASEIIREARAALAATKAAQTPMVEFDDCTVSPTGKHSKSWFANGDCSYCNDGAQPDAPLFYASVAPKVVPARPAGRVYSANCEYAVVEWYNQTSDKGGGDPKNARSWPIAGDAVYLTGAHLGAQRNEN